MMSPRSALRQDRHRNRNGVTETDSEEPRTSRLRPAQAPGTAPNGRSVHSKVRLVGSSTAGVVQAGLVDDGCPVERKTLDRLDLASAIERI